MKILPRKVRFYTVKCFENITFWSEILLWGPRIHDCCFFHLLRVWRDRQRKVWENSSWSSWDIRFRISKISKKLSRESWDDPTRRSFCHFSAKPHLLLPRIFFPISRYTHRKLTNLTNGEFGPVKENFTPRSKKKYLKLDILTTIKKKFVCWINNLQLHVLPAWLLRLQYIL